MDVTMGNPLVGDDVFGGHFPEGMRVLAVDGDQACLTVLENLLHECRYNVTTAPHSTMALEMLRGNRNNFDMVITAVNKPDMDGFFLLKQMRLEMMDIPVIMLSEHSDKELVMRCVQHGACNYLMKPVRMEEMKTVWQHVARKKMIGCSDQNQAGNKDKTCNVAGEGCSDQNQAANKDKTCNVAGEGCSDQNQAANNDKTCNVAGEGCSDQNQAANKDKTCNVAGEGCSDQNQAANNDKTCNVAGEGCSDQNQAANKDKTCNVAGEGCSDQNQAANKDKTCNVAGEGCSDQNQAANKDKTCNVAGEGCSDQNQAANKDKTCNVAGEGCSDQNQAANKDKTCNVAGEGSSHGCTVSENRTLGQKQKELREDEKVSDDDDDKQSSGKKPRLVWTTDLHSKFVEAVQQLGLENAVPKRIRELMNVEGLTNKHVSSHLQKHKLKLQLKL